MKTKIHFTSLAFLLYTGFSSFGQAGALDPAFTTGLGANSAVQTLAIRNDGKILIGGQFGSYDSDARFRLALLKSNGNLDSGVDPGLVESGVVLTTAFQSDGKFIYGGTFTYGVSRRNANGTADYNFNSGSGANDFVITCKIQGDGKILIGGDFTTFNGSSRSRIARLNSSGTLDGTFNPGTGADDIIGAIALQNDGNIIIGGDFTSYNGVSKNRVVRLTGSGSLDPSFDPGAGANANISAIVIQNDGKIIIAGNFTSYNGTAINRIARLNTDGSLDGSFNTGLGADQPIATISLQADEKIVIGGSFTNYDGTGRNRIARLNTDGSLDTGFDPGTGTGLVTASAIQSDGKILIGGDFTSYNGTGRGRVARIIAQTNSTGLNQNNLEKQNNFIAYPNPFRSSVTFELDKTSQVTVINATGQEVYSGKFSSGLQQVDLNYLPAGIYMLKAENGTSFKIVKE